MAIRRTIFKSISWLLGLLLLAWIGFEIFHGNYLQAVAISGVSSLLLWFMLGLWRRPSDDD